LSLKTKEILKLPNLLSLFRIILLFPLCYFLIYGFDTKKTEIAIIILTMGATDMLDGFIARKFNMITETGKIIDPIADKTAIILISLILLFKEIVPLWFFLVIIIRDFSILFLGMILKRKYKLVLMSNYPGKLAALFIGISLLFAILRTGGNELLFFINSLLYYIATILIIYSSFLYFIRFKKNIGEKNYARN
jgi:CDP-diacylglycerol--glycerol-3-phosphate 3-phosphatidyltransferase